MAAAAMGVTVMPGGGITAANASLLAEWLPVTEVHASCASALPDPEDSRIAAFGFQLPGARGTDVAKVQALRQALDQIGRSRPSGWISS
jgi:copper homeostasis protein